MTGPEQSTWRYTASSQEVVRTDGVLIAREVPPEFGKLVEAAPVLLDAIEGLLDFIRIDRLPMDKDALYIAQQAIARARQ